jgi:hypothetical protein
LPFGPDGMYCPSDSQANKNVTAHGAMLVLSNQKYLVRACSMNKKKEKKVLKNYF